MPFLLLLHSLLAPQPLYWPPAVQQVQDARDMHPNYYDVLNQTILADNIYRYLEKCRTTDIVATKDGRTIISAICHRDFNNPQSN